ncbi:uncharacterized protein BJ171DRAFT_577352 [Polychytrium aggregatum]|uniref:uncharacterized protein n=1 Tax=Polychytrium aggregatum TaxID=110093 RepID=UPI0022FE29C6|nr:uncharacterized protein BJ171DRAFT_577352 [Polychytrium aggregatum]KAI9209003.1 hypothetical protein BJ171DRAFT_577352 [Polychytrium aggregatum]
MSDADDHAQAPSNFKLASQRFLAKLKKMPSSQAMSRSKSQAPFTSTSSSNLKYHSSQSGSVQPTYYWNSDPQHANHDKFPEPSPPPHSSSSGSSSSSTLASTLTSPRIHSEPHEALSLSSSDTRAPSGPSGSSTTSHNLRRKMSKVALISSLRSNPDPPPAEARYGDSIMQSKRSSTSSISDHSNLSSPTTNGSGGSPSEGGPPKWKSLFKSVSRPELKPFVTKKRSMNNLSQVKSSDSLREKFLADQQSTKHVRFPKENREGGGLLFAIRPSNNDLSMSRSKSQPQLKETDPMEAQLAYSPAVPLVLPTRTTSNFVRFQSGQSYMPPQQELPPLPSTLLDGKAPPPLPSEPIPSLQFISSSEQARLTPKAQVLSPPQQVLSPPKQVLSPPQQVLSPPKQTLPPPPLPPLQTASPPQPLRPLPHHLRHQMPPDAVAAPQQLFIPAPQARKPSARPTSLMFEPDLTPSGTSSSPLPASLSSAYVATALAASSVSPTAGAEGTAPNTQSLRKVRSRRSYILAARDPFELTPELIARASASWAPKCGYTNWPLLIPLLKADGRTPFESELYWKILFRKLPVNSVLRNPVTVTCPHCAETETLEHFIIECPNSRQFWRQVGAVLSQAVRMDLTDLALRDIVFMFPDLPSNPTEAQFHVLTVCHSVAVWSLWSARDYAASASNDAWVFFETRLKARIALERDSGIGSRRFLERWGSIPTFSLENWPTVTSPLDERSSP